MTQSSFLEDFSSQNAHVGSAAKPLAASADELRASFDEGYKCGWQDAESADHDSERDIQEALSSALQAMNFTYFEARQHIMQSVRPVLEAMIDAILPQLLSKSLGGRVVEILADITETAESTVTIACAAESSEMLRALAKEQLKFPVKIEIEPTLTASQAVVHLNDGQARIDLDATLDEIRNCVDTFFDTSEKKEAAHA